MCINFGKGPVIIWRMLSRGTFVIVFALNMEGQHEADTVSQQEVSEMKALVAWKPRPGSERSRKPQKRAGGGVLLPRCLSGFANWCEHRAPLGSVQGGAAREPAFRKCFRVMLPLVPVPGREERCVTACSPRSSKAGKTAW